PLSARDFYRSRYRSLFLLRLGSRGGSSLLEFLDEGERRALNLLRSRLCYCNRSFLLTTLLRVVVAQLDYRINGSERSTGRLSALDRKRFLIRGGGYGIFVMP
ncbi:hypothetical protein PFISCL1PPCAC_553, partial [Pristionchus fissidentatus]